MNDKVRVVVRTAEPLCEHCPSSDGTRAWIWYFIKNAEGKQEIKIVCQKCSAELYVRNDEIHLEFQLIQPEPTPPPPPPKRYYNNPYAHVFTEFDKSMLKSLRISSDGITVGKRIDE